MRPVLPQHYASTSPSGDVIDTGKILVTAGQGIYVNSAAQPITNAGAIIDFHGSPVLFRTAGRPAVLSRNDRNSRRTAIAGLDP